MSHWKIIDNFFETNRYHISKHHLDSYNDLIYNGINKTIKSMNPFVILKKDPDNKEINKPRKQ